MGKGTGLGMPIVLKILEAHDMLLSIEDPAAFFVGPTLCDPAARHPSPGDLGLLTNPWWHSLKARFIEEIAAASDAGTVAAV